MLAELLEYWLSPCPRPWRGMGYLREQIAIDARLARNREAWASHQACTREQILRAAARCPGRRCALVLGAGLAHDIPLRELCARFGRVVLADLVHRPRHRRAAVRAGALCAEWDASGVLADLWRRGAQLDDETLLSLVRGASPGLPEETRGEPDLVVSANLASQLMLLPAEWLASVRGRGPAADDFASRLAEAAARRHLAWLDGRSGIRLLVTDVARLRVPVQARRRGAATAGRGAGRGPAPEGAGEGAGDGEADVEALPGVAGPGEPAARWRWRVAPAPEASRTHHLEHEVAAWLW